LETIPKKNYEYKMKGTSRVCMLISGCHITACQQF
jgi:hypothetical protein